MDYELHKVIRLEVIGPYKLRASFEDGTCQEADLRPILSGRIYSPLKDLKLFNQVYLDDGVPTWPTGADFSPNMLHDWPERLPALLKKAEEWRRGFELTPAEERPPIVFDWDEINELVEGKVEEYRKRLPYLYNSIGRIELDIEVAKQLYAMVPHSHLQRRIKALEESLQQTRESLDSRLEKFRDEVAEKIAQYCSTIKKNMKEDLQGIKEDLQSIEAQLRDSKGEWQWHVTLIIMQIPSGHLATYGCIGNVANQLFGHNLIPRNVAWLRNRLYGLLTHDTLVPLHRLAKAGDVQSCADSEITKPYNDRLRGQEGSLTNPVWWDPSPESLRRLKLELALFAQQNSKKRSILELRGLGKEIWQGVNAQTYVDRLREEWDTNRDLTR